MRIAVGGIWTETNTMAPEPTTLQSFVDYHYYVGGDLTDAMRGTSTEVGGAMDEASSAGIEIVPLLFSAALPGGTVPRADFEHMLTELTNVVLATEPFDALLLVLHGAMVVEGIPDPETLLVSSLRVFLGEMPIAVTLDFHANTSIELAQATDFLTCYRTYPHVDMAERGAEAIAALVRMLREQRKPKKTLIKVPLLTMPVAQETSRTPMLALIQQMDQLRSVPGVWGLSTTPGFAYADSSRLGMAVYVASDSEPEVKARLVARSAWQHRDDFRFEVETPLEAATAARRERGPVVLVDVVDNVGGGSPGDSTAILHALRAAGETDSVSVLWDPKVVRELHHASDYRMNGSLGSHSAPGMGGPFHVDASVTCHGRVEYRRTSNYMTGSSVDMGLVAVVQADIGLIVLTEHRIVPFDDDHLRALGIDPEEHHVLVAKGAIAWKAAFGDYAAETHYVDGPGSCPVNFSALEHPDRQSQLFPLDPIAENLILEGHAL